MAHGLIDWLREQLDADERVALAASPGPWRVDPNDNEQVLAVDGIEVAAFALSSNQVRNTAIHIATFDPERVLAEVKAHRAILAGFEASYRQSDDYPGWEGAMYAIAQPYAGRSGWQDEWSVSE